MLTFGSIHLSFMASVGIWLWQDPPAFGPASVPTRCDITLTVLGASVPFSSQPLRIFSLMVYSLFLVPGLNLIPPFVFFLTFHILYNWSRERYESFRNRLDAEFGQKMVNPVINPQVM
ncbi:hypothetical protein GYMLUDRAFT_775343 [Collybiopsis luxurians FD-317 M1]|uniref:Uncharacterized protein n=1 Tax=Collybiopsis luxurians FD-317 M1 TaxID=944289 RepID=A0A0D0BP65_9AGAR|nr:hypothetical protein GYMLUDRAFT_775343 [Collybiopsis luxurians FD-317 M1]